MLTNAQHSARILADGGPDVNKSEQGANCFGVNDLICAGSFGVGAGAGGIMTVVAGDLLGVIVNEVSELPELRSAVVLVEDLVIRVEMRAVSGTTLAGRANPLISSALPEG